MNSVLKIALGVVLGLMLFGALGICAAIFVGGVVLNSASTEAEKSRAAWTKQAELHRARVATQQPNNPYVTPRQDVAKQPLNSDERCMGGKKFRRIENGWEQLPAGQCAR